MARLVISEDQYRRIVAALSPPELLEPGGDKAELVARIRKIKEEAKARVAKIKEKYNALIAVAAKSHRAPLKREMDYEINKINTEAAALIAPLEREAKTKASAARNARNSATLQRVREIESLYKELTGLSSFTCFKDGAKSICPTRKARAEEYLKQHKYYYEIQTKDA